MSNLYNCSAVSIFFLQSFLLFITTFISSGLTFILLFAFEVVFLKDLEKPSQYCQLSASILSKAFILINPAFLTEEAVEEKSPIIFDAHSSIEEFSRAFIVSLFD